MPPSTHASTHASLHTNAHSGCQVGEMMDARYEVFASNGKGVFSTVVRARDTARRDEHGKHPEVAIKLIRSNETMFKVG